MICYIVIVLLNVYVYVILDRKNMLLDTRNKDFNIEKSTIYLYLFISLIVPIIEIIVIVEFLNGF